MKYIVWISGVLAGAVFQAMLNNYLPLYLSPNLFLMFVLFMSFYYEYYTAVAAVIFLSFLAAVFSSGTLWFYVFSFLLVFYLLTFLRKFFDRNHALAVAAMAALTTLLYPFIVLLLSIVPDRTSLFRIAFLTAILQLPVNMAAAYFLFRYLPAFSDTVRNRLSVQKVQ